MKPPRLFLFAALVLAAGCQVKPREEPTGDEGPPITSVQLEDPGTGIALTHPSWLTSTPGEAAFGSVTRLVPSTPTTGGYDYVIELKREPNFCRELEPGAVPPGYGFLQSAINVSGVTFPLHTEVITTPEWTKRVATYQANVKSWCVSFRLEETLKDPNARTPDHIVPNFRAILASARLIDLDSPAAGPDSTISNAVYTPVPGTILDLRKLAGESPESVQNELGGNFEVKGDESRRLPGERNYNVAGGQLKIVYYQNQAYRLYFTSTAITRSPVDAIRQIGFDVSGLEPDPGTQGLRWSGSFGTNKAFRSVRPTRLDSAGNFNGAEVEIDLSTRPRR